MRLRYLVRILFSIIFYCSLLILSPRDCFSQSITWQRTYDGPFSYKETGYSLCPADSNNFYVVGDTYHPTNPGIRYVYVLKLNPYGDTIWTRYIGWSDMKIGHTSVSDGKGNCVFTGDGDTSFSAKINSDGEIIWWKNYGMSQVQCFDIKKTSEGGYVASGRKLGTDWYGYALKVDSVGTLQWQKLYLSTEYKEYMGVFEADNGGYYLAGIVQDQPLDTQQILITRIDNTGNVTWEKRHTIYGFDANVNTAIKMNNGNFLIAGTTGDTTYTYSTAYFMRLDSSGVPFYIKRFLVNKNEYFETINILNPNKYLVVTYRDSTFYISSSKVLITDSLGNIIRQQLFTVNNPAGYITLKTSMSAGNGDLIFGGYSELTNNDRADIFVARTDSLLNVPPISVIQINNNIPTMSQLFPAYPNPFNPSTNIKFDITESGIVKLTVYDILGKALALLVNKGLNPGSYEVKFDATNFASGIYFYSLESGSFRETKKMLLIK